MPSHPVFRILPLAAAIVLLALIASCGGNDKNPMNPGGGGSGADVTISIVGMLGSSSYSPSPDTVTVGQTVSWKNNDGTTHTATSDIVAFGTGSISPGATSAPIAMNSAGTFPYHCAIHNSMTGNLVVKP